MAHSLRADLNLLSSVLLVTIAAGAPTVAAEQPAELTMAGLASWLEDYGEAWESRDPEKAAMLFTEDARYQVTPYEPPHRGQSGVRAYWESVTSSQRNVRFRFQPLSVTGGTGIAHWSAAFDVEPAGTRIELDGIFVLEFDRSGRCRRLREWWHLHQGDHGGGGPPAREPGSEEQS